ncbi:OmpA family protein [Hugenholtzia roseola]|uniref:OmpA family protein n=1 Tax=Hugenholtzia roseola TaxID=1002 RepID=UPI00041FA9DC|nr:OmpA family protein [Hugenholtzia roseola]
MKKIIFILFGMLSGVFSLSAQETLVEALQAMKVQDYEKSIKIYESYLTKKNNYPPALFGVAKAMLLQHQKRQSIKKNAENLLFYDFKHEHAYLKKAFSYAKDAEKYYNNAKEDEKFSYVKEGISNFKDVFNLKEGISKEAADLILKAPYNFHYTEQPKVSPFHLLENADTTQELRHLLISQATDYLQHYEKTRSLPLVRNIRRRLLEEFISIAALRGRGTGNGFFYEKFCDCILEDFKQEEISHILPQYYGAYFGWNDFGYQKDENYIKINQLAIKYKLGSILNLFCTLNLHHKGYEEKNRALYEDFIKTLAPSDVAFIALQKMTVPFLEAKKWEEASNLYQSFSSYFPEKIADFQKIDKILATPEDELLLIPLGKSINSIRPETAPVPTAEEDGLYFCRYHIGSGQDIFYASIKNDNFETAFALPTTINTKTHEVPQSISFDGNTLVIFGNYENIEDFKLEMKKENPTMGNGDLYYIEKDEQFNWQKIKPFPTPINTPAYEAALTFTADGKAAFFVSDRTGTVGGHFPKAPKNRLYYHGREEFNTDIFVVERNEEGWSEPINLGAIINTKYAESLPFLHPDMKTLYFISDGQAGLGSGDIFMSKRLNENSWTEWSEPVNLGKSINTAYLDGFYMGTSGKFAYIVLKNQPNGEGSYDIFKFEVPQRFRPEPVITLTGFIKDENNKPIEADIVWEDLTTGKIVGRVANRKQDGSFRVTMPKDKPFGVYAEKKGLYSTSQNNQNVTFITEINQQKINSNVRENQNITLLSSQYLAEKQKKIQLNNLFFDFDKDSILPTSYPELERLIQFLNENKDLKIRIEGHTDNQGKAEYNLTLSEKRAEKVANYLIKRGIAAHRVFFKGYGSEKPIADNFTPEGRAQNRRVEFSLKTL